MRNRTGASGDIQILSHRKGREDSPSLRNQAYAQPGNAIGLEMGDLLSIESNTALTRRGKSNDGAKKRRFPRPIPAKESNHLALFNV
jgi:hypothetical protein